MAKQEKEVRFISVKISQSLYDEIDYTKKNLKKTEKKKPSGKKRRKWNFLDASDELGKHLKSLRGSSK